MIAAQAFKMQPERRNKNNDSN